jgi:hypothetical protein
MPALAVATAHTFVLTVSHGLLFRQPLDLLQWQVCHCFLSSLPCSTLTSFSLASVSNPSFSCQAFLRQAFSQVLLHQAFSH